MLESDGPGGAEVVMFQLSEELRRKGHEVVHVGPEAGVGWLGDRFRQAGFPSETFRLRRAVDFRCLNELTETLRKARVDVVHSHEFTMCVYGAAAARRLGIPHVTTMHGNQTMMDALRRRVALRWAFRRARMVVGCSDATRDVVEEGLGLSPGTVHSIRNGVPERPGRREPVRRELGLSEDELLVAAVGNVVPRKGHLVLLQALALLEDDGLDVPWRVVVAGAKRDATADIEALVAERGWGERVHLLGARDDVPDLLAAADVFSMPSLWEGLPLAVLEAMFAGLPIVASRTSGIPEAIDSDRVGLLATPGDVPELAEHLGAVLRDPELRDRLGSAARERAHQEFTVSVMADRYLASYRGERA
ncbi:MAG: glycosyltransferase family 4 protein [Gemmatimonadota bacterium]